VQAFAANKHVVFGDVNLSEQRISGPPHNPGQGGWPTIRYFNSTTGLDGGAYVQLEEVAICEELGKEEAMMGFIEEYGNTSLCSVVDGNGCDEKSWKYVEKMRNQGREAIVSQLVRLEGMDSTAMKPDLGVWLKQRIKILRQLKGSMGAMGEEL